MVLLITVTNHFTSEILMQIVLLEGLTNSVCKILLLAVFRFKSILISVQDKPFWLSVMENMINMF